MLNVLFAPIPSSHPLKAPGRGYVERSQLKIPLSILASAVLHYLYFQAAPITDTETVEMPVPLFPTCIDTCGCMVALGTREGPVLLFDLSPRDQEQEQERHHQKQQASNGSKVVRVYGSLSAGEGPVASVLLDRAKVVVAGRLSRRREGGHFIRCALPCA